MKKNLKIFFKILTSTAVFCFSLNAFSQANINNQIHSDRVSAVFVSETSSSDSKDFFTCDEDGFIIKWEDDLQGQHYQVSDLKISLAAKCSSNNGSNLIALYETDGYLQNRVSVLDWTNYKKLYSLHFTETVTSVAFSEAGSYLIVGTNSVDDLYIYNAKDGQLIKKVQGIPAMISMIKTSDSEKSMVLYSLTGAIIYYDLINQKIKARFSTEKLLEQTVLFGTGDKKNSYLAGVKGNYIYIINALSGKTLSTYQTSKPLLCVSKSKEEKGLYFVYPSSAGYTVRLITNDTLSSLYDKKTTVITTTLIKNLTGFAASESITAISKNIDTIILGTRSGNVYTISDEVDEVTKVTRLTQNIYSKIYDAAFIEDDLYTITDTAVYKTNFDDKSLTKIIDNTNGWTNISAYKGSLILWAKNTKKPVYSLNVEDGSKKNLFTPASYIWSVTFFEDRLVYTQAKTRVLYYDFNKATVRRVYDSSGIENAVMVSNNDIYVAKAKTSSLDAALMKVNRLTMETVPIKNSGDLMMSINFDENAEEKVIYGATITNNDGYSTTSLIAYSIEENTIVNLYSLNEEDSTSVFSALSDKYIYSNIGKDYVTGLSRSDFKQSIFKRAAAIPMKVTAGKNRMVILNYDGSLSWYNKNSQYLLGTWFLKKDGNWVEF